MMRTLAAAGIAVSIAFLLLRFLHLGADFPAHSLWSDESGRYTDEGWYAAGALHKALTGHWLMPGDFNAMVTAPVWPLVLHLVFGFTGVSIVAARAVESICSILVVVFGTMLVRRHLPHWTVPAFILLATSASLFVFARLALLELPMTAAFVAALLVAPRSSRGFVTRTVASASLLCAAMLIKSSALFLLPAFCVYVWGQHSPEETRRGRLLRAIAPAALFLLMLGAYGVLVILPHFADFQALKAQNGAVLTRHSPRLFVRVLFRGITWTDPVLFPVAAVAIASAATVFQNVRRSPLFSLAVVWDLGFALFCVMHVTANPRYFVVFLIPSVMLSLLLLNELAAHRPRAAVLLGSLLAMGAVCNVVYMVSLMLRPRYSMQNACAQIQSIIRASGDPHPLVFGHGAVETTFFTGIDGMDDMGSLPLLGRLDTYRPGWLFYYSGDEGTLQNTAVSSRYLPVLMGDWQVMGEKNRSHLLLYKLQSKPVRP